MRDTLLVIQIVLSILIVVSVLLQNRAEGMGGIFGGGGEIFRTKRGLEKFLYYATIVLTVLFASLSLIIVKLSN